MLLDSIKDPYPVFDDVPKQADVLEALVTDIAGELVPVLQQQEPGVDWHEILTLLREEHSLIANEGVQSFQARFKTPAGDIDSQKLAAYERLALVKNTVRSYAPVLVERAYNTDTGAVFNLLRENVREMKVLGFSYNDTVKFFDQDAKISKSPTPHPTEGLSINGIKLACALVACAEEQGDERDKALFAAVRQMVLSDDLGASKKFSIVDEAELSDFYAHNHNTGISELERIIEDAIESEYGRRPDLTLDAALRSWDYDSDGKNNADGFAFIAKVSRTTLGALDQIIVAIDATNPRSAALDEFHADCLKVQAALQPVYNRSAEITQKLAEIENPAQRQAYYSEVYKEYKDLAAGFGKVYEAVGSENRGFDFYLKALNVLGESVESLGGSHAKGAQPLDDALRLIRRTGFALEKGQPRQNDFEHIGIINNLFNSPNLRKRGIFRDDEFAEMDAAGGYKNLAPERQQKFLGVLSSYVAENGNRKEILSDINEANPLEFDPDGNGYPLQTRTLLDRLAVEQLYQLKFDQNIISDAQPGSDERMHFLFQVFGIKKGTSMSLHEDRGTLPRRAQLLQEFALSAGGQALSKTRNFYSSILKGTPLDKTSGKDTWAIIHPASDAERGGGFGTRMESAQTWRKIAVLSYNSGITIAQMLGGGMSLNRFGANPMILFNTVAEELKSTIKGDGKGRFDRRVQHDRHIMRSATSMLFTEQGRHKRYNMATPMQVASDVSRKLSRMISIRFDLEGLVEDNTSIAEKPELENKKVQSRIDRLWKKSIDRFNDMRFAKGSDGIIILNKLAEKITTPHTIGNQNRGARPAAKSGSAKDMTGVRAIENDARYQISQTFAGGFLAAGQMMRDLATDLSEGKITFDTVQNWIEHREWDFSVHGKCLIDAGRFDPTYALDQLGWPEATFDELKEVGAQVLFTKGKGSNNIKMTYKGPRQDLSEEKIYFAKIWYERLLYVSHMEAALNGRDAPLNLQSKPEEIMAAFRPENNAPHYGLGEKTKAKWGDVVTTLDEHARNKPQFAIQHMREEQIDRDVQSGISKEEAVKRQGGAAILSRSSATYRAGTAPHWIYWASKNRYGTMPRPPGFTIEGVMTPKARADVARLAYAAPDEYEPVI